MSNLPPSWISATLGETCSIVGGSTPKSTESSYWNGDIPWITPDDLSRHKDKIILGGRRSITQAGFASCSTRMVPAETVLFTSRAPIGYVAIAGQPVCTNQGFKSLIPPSVISSDYLYWYMRYATDLVKARASGTTFAEISGRAMAAVPLLLAPRSEQERIVAAIEEQFSRINAGVEALERVLYHLDRMRAAAFLQMHTKALMSSTLRPLTEASEFIVDGDHNPPKRTNSGVPYLTAKHVKRGTISTEGASFISRGDFTSLRRRYDPQGGDVLVTCVGTLGEVAIVPNGLVFAADRNLAAIRPSPEVIPAFLEAILRSPRIQKVLTAGSGSTAQPHLYLRDLRQLEIPVPEVDAQKSLFESLQEQLAFADQLEKDVRTSLARAEQLRTSVLVAAFSGNLVSQDPRDEPASVLLERIATELPARNGRNATQARKPRVARKKVTA